MSIINNSIIAGASGQAGGAAAGYEIERSLRFNSPDSAYLNRTFSAGNRRTWTWSGWVKRGLLGTGKYALFGGSGTNSMIRFNNDDGGDGLRVLDAATGGYDLITNRKFRDTSAWYHFVVAVDTTQSTASNRVKIYVNGVQETSFYSSSYPTQNAELTFNNNISHTVGYAPASTYHDGYLADVHFIDGQALDPTSFGEFDETTGVWNPKAFNGFNNPNDGTTWSNSLTSSNGFWPGQGATNAFNGTGSTVTGTNDGGTLTFSPNLTIPANSVIEIRCSTQSNGYTVVVNGVSNDFDNADDFKVVSYDGSTTLSTITITNKGSASGDLKGIKINGYLLVDGAGDNSFHLDFADNSSAAALGYDAAGSNDWTVNNISIGVPTYTGNVTATASPSGSSMIIKAVGATVTGTFNAASGTGGSINYYTSSNGIDWSFQETSSGQSSSFTAKYISMGGGSNDVRQFTSTSGSYKYSISGSTSLDNNAATVTVDQTGLFNESGNDSLRDSPTNGDTADDTGAGGEVPGNYCTWNPLSNSGSAPTNGNLTLPSNGGVYVRCNATQAVSSGKWYFEITLSTAGTVTAVGIAKDYITNKYPGEDANSYARNLEDGNTLTNNTSIGNAPTLTSGDVFSCALDLDNNKVWFGKNGVWTNPNSTTGNPVSGANPTFTISAGTYTATARVYASGQIDANFGQRPFAYQAPTGFQPFATPFLDDPTIADGSTAFEVITYQGNGTSQTLPNTDSTTSPQELKFSPDFVWIKNRSVSASHTVYDTIREAAKALIPSSTSSELSVPNHLTAFTSDGFSVGSDSNPNGNGNAIVAWTWDAGGDSNTFNVDGTGYATTSAAGITEGTISLTGASVNRSAGFSIVTYTGNGTSGATVGHGLGVKPSMVIIKSRSIADNWLVAHEGAGTTGDTLGGFAESYTLYLESTAAKANFTNAAAALGNSSVFAVADGSEVNQNTATYVAYCFAPVESYSSFGLYQGNGSADGPFVYCGFRPKYILVKNSSIVDNWEIYDTARSAYNATDHALRPDTDGAEFSHIANNRSFDINSNGFKVRGSNAGINGSGNTLIYYAVAENPFKTARAR